jgi:putative transposase
MNRRQAYPTDLNDAAWGKIEPHLPKPKMGRPPKYSRRELLDAIWYVLRNGITWRALPHDFPPWKTVYSYFRSLKGQGVCKRLNDALRVEVRQQAGKKPEASLLIGDSQSVKTTEKGGLAAMTEASK